MISATFAVWKRAPDTACATLPPSLRISQARLAEENARLRAELEKTERDVKFQRKVSATRMYETSSSYLVKVQTTVRTFIYRVAYLQKRDAVVEIQRMASVCIYS